jgi:hypothetical protein
LFSKYILQAKLFNINFIWKHCILGQILIKYSVGEVALLFKDQASSGFMPLQPLRWNYKTSLSSAPNINFVTLVMLFSPADAGLCRNCGSSLSEASLQCFYLPAPLQGV